MLCVVALTALSPDERRTIFDVESAGIINHLWITIAPPPDQLLRNDIILRMWWDREGEPSAEVPLGPFRQGWEESYEYAAMPLAVGPRDGHGNVLTLDLRWVAYWYRAEPHKPFSALPSAEVRKPQPPHRPGGDPPLA